MLELNYFIKHFPKIDAHFRAMEKERRIQLAKLLYTMRSRGLMFHETVEGYDALFIEQWFLHSNFWLAQQQIHVEVLDDSVVLKGVEDLFNLMLPQMTLIGKKRYKESLKNIVG